MEHDDIELALQAKLRILAEREGRDAEIIGTYVIKKPEPVEEPMRVPPVRQSHPTSPRQRGGR